MTKAGERLLRAAREMQAYAAGDESQVRVHVPEKIDVKAIRENLGMSQDEFALRFGFSLGTLRHWEQGRRQPEGPARAYLKVIARAPEAVERALAAV